MKIYTILLPLLVITSVQAKESDQWIMCVGPGDGPRDHQCVKSVSGPLHYNTDCSKVLPHPNPARPNEPYGRARGIFANRPGAASPKGDDGTIYLGPNPKDLCIKRCEKYAADKSVITCILPE